MDHCRSAQSSYAACPILVVHTSLNALPPIQHCHLQITHTEQLPQAPTSAIGGGRRSTASIVRDEIFAITGHCLLCDHCDTCMRDHCCDGHFHRCTRYDLCCDLWQTREREDKKRGQEGTQCQSLDSNQGCTTHRLQQTTNCWVPLPLSSCPATFVGYKM